MLKFLKIAVAHANCLILLSKNRLMLQYKKVVQRYLLTLYSALQVRIQQIICKQMVN